MPAKASTALSPASIHLARTSSKLSDGTNRQVTGQSETFLALQPEPACRTDGLPPLMLRVASTVPEQSERSADSVHDDKDAGPPAMPATDPSEGDVAQAAARKKAQAKKKKERSTLNKAERAAREPKAVSFSLLEAVRNFEVAKGGHPAKLYLDRDDDGNFYIQDTPLSSVRTEMLFNEVLTAVRDELWFAHRHLPFAQQWLLSHEAAALSRVLVKRGTISLQGARELAEKISVAASHQTPQALKAHWMALVKADAHPASLLEKAASYQVQVRTVRVSQLCDYLPRAIACAFANWTSDADRYSHPVRSRREVEAILSQTMLSQASSTSVLAGLLTTAHENPTVSEHLLDFAARLGEFAATPQETQALDTMSVALLVSLSPKVLRKMVVTREELAWIQRHVFILGGHLGDIELAGGMTRWDVTANSLDAFDPLQLLRLGEQYMKDEVGLKAVTTLLSATGILQANIEEEEARIEKLVQIESRLRLADPQVNFEGLALDELLNAFVPRKHQVPLALRAQEHQALTHVEPATTTVQAEVTAPATAHIEELEPEDTLEHWQGVWNGYREKNLHRHRETAAVLHQGAPLDSDDEDEAKRSLFEVDSTAAPNADGRQPGARPRLAGYNHHLPSGDKHLPNAVSKARMHDIVDAIRHGRKYTQDDRYEARQRMIRNAHEVD